MSSGRAGDAHSSCPSTAISIHLASCCCPSSYQSIPSTLPSALASMGSDPQYLKFPNLFFAQHVFNLSNPACPQSVQQTSLKNLQGAISENKMAPFYRFLAHPVEGILNNSGEGVTQHPPHAPGAGSSAKSSIATNMLASRKPSLKIEFPWDEQLYQSLVEDNKKDLESFQKEEDDAEEAAGETEVLAARGKRAEFWARVGDKVCPRTWPGLSSD